MSPTRRRGLPPLALGALYALLVAAPVLIAFATGQHHRLTLMRAAAATGMAAGVMLFLQMVTSGRFEAISGRIGIDVTMAFHKWAAPVALGLAALHVLFLIGPPDPDRPARALRRLQVVLTQTGLDDARAAVLLLAVLVVLALLRDRLRVRYELWRGSHALMALALIGLVLWHILGDGKGGTLTKGFWVLLALAATLPALNVHLRRLLAPKTKCWTLFERRKVADRLWEVVLASPDGGLPFRAGQFAWLSFGGHRLALYDHPFSIASAPGAQHLRFLIQEAGDFTRGIGDLALGTPVRIDAPHGSFGLNPGLAGGILLIAGGVGVAPILSVLNGLAASGCTQPVRLIYAAREPGAMLPAAFWQPACDQLGLSPVLLADHDGAAVGIAQGPLTEAHLTAALQGLDPAQMQALICGPGPMMTAATDMLVRLGVPLNQIDYERFSYAAGTLSAKDRRMLSGFATTWAAIAAVVLAYALA